MTSLNGGLTSKWCFIPNAKINAAERVAGGELPAALKATFTASKRLSLDDMRPLNRPHTMLLLLWYRDKNINLWT